MQDAVFPIARIAALEAMSYESVLISAAKDARYPGATSQDRGEGDSTSDGRIEGQLSRAEMSVELGWPTETRGRSCEIGLTRNLRPLLLLLP